MKHPLAVAVGEAYNAALSLAVQEGYMSLQAAEFVAKTFGPTLSEYLKGNSIFGRKLGDLSHTGEVYEKLLTQQKINLQQFGD